MQATLSPLFRGMDVKHRDGRTARVVAIESAHVHARLWSLGWPFPGLLVTWKRADVERIDRPQQVEDALL